MNTKKEKESISINRSEIAVGVSVMICLLLCTFIGKLGFTVQTLAACTGAVMCTQDAGKASWKAGLTRILGVISGGLVGIVLVALDNVLQMTLVFCLLCGVGVVANLFICKLLKIPFIQAKVSCMTLLLVVLVLGGEARFSYAFGRFVGTLFGAVIALLVSMLFEVLRKDKGGVQERQTLREEEEVKVHKKAIIFDLDGVLVFTDRFHYQAWKLLTDRLGIYFDETINNRLRGVSRMESLDIILERSSVQYSQEEKERFAAEKNESYRELLSGMTPEDVSEETRSALAELRRRGYRLAVGSSSKNTKFILEQVGLTDCFDAITDGTNIVRSKPDPEVFIKAAEYLGEAAENCAVVEDAYAGIDAAKAAGMTAIGIGDASSYDRTDQPIQKFSQLLDLFPDCGDLKANHK